MNKEPVVFPRDLETYVVHMGEGWKEVAFGERAPNPLVSVVVTTYQHEKYISETLDSILAQQTSFPYEILLGEDGSQDGTRQICIEYAKKHADKIRLILHDRTKKIVVRGRPTGRYNLLTNFSSSNGKYIALCEGDDFWNDNRKLQKQVDFLEHHPTVVLSFHDCITIAPDGKLIDKSLLKSNARDLSQIDLIQGRRVPTLTVMFRTKDCMLGGASGGALGHVLHLSCLVGLGRDDHCLAADGEE